MGTQLQQHQFKDFVLYIKSDDFDDIYPNNKFDYFHTILPFRYNLVQAEQHAWQVGVLDLAIGKVKSSSLLRIPQSCVLMCNIVEGSTVISNTQRPVLKHIWANQGNLIDSSGTVVYHSLEHHTFQEIVFELVDFDLQKINRALWDTLAEAGEKLTLTLVLHFQLSPSL